MKAKLMVLHAVLVLAVCVSGCFQSEFQPYASLSQASPDGDYLAEVVEVWVPERDRRFEVRITFNVLSPPEIKTVFRSPDEGRIAERLIWSKDSRHVLLLGKYLVTSPDLMTDKGDALYLLYDTKERKVCCNSSQVAERFQGFDFGDLAEIDFGEKFRPLRQSR